MNDGLRWLLVLGCLCIVFLEAPQDLLQILQDSSGAYPTRPSSLIEKTRMANPSVLRGPTAEDVAPSFDEAATPSLAFTKLETAPDRFASPAAPAAKRVSRGSEEDGAHELRGDKAELRPESALVR
jgi:hypothetical protein